MKLLNVDQNPKTVKGQKRGYLTGVLYLAPADLSGYEVCPKRSPSCSHLCLNTSGHGVFDMVQQARIRKTKFFFEDRESFMEQLAREIDALGRKAKKLGMTPVVRLNGTSDIAWERVSALGEPNIMAVFPQIQFYDYTKVLKRIERWSRGELPANYHLTFSRAENNDKDALKALELKANVAVVFRSRPPTYMGVSVIDGDEDDLRFTMPQGFASTTTEGVIIGLKPKGRARKDMSGFVV